MNNLFSSIVFARPNGGRIQLPADVILLFQDYIQFEHYKPEAGGVLLGRYIIGTSDVVIDKITFPMPGDKASRTTFFRKKQAHQAIIDKEWFESGGTSTYLGEWHTHPERVPSPSCIDRHTWKKKLKKDVFDSDCLFFLIIGTSEIKVWEGSQKLMKFDLLEKL